VERVDCADTSWPRHDVCAAMGLSANGALMCRKIRKCGCAGFGLRCRVSHRCNDGRPDPAPADPAPAHRCNDGRPDPAPGPRAWRAWRRRNGDPAPRAPRDPAPLQ
jgi:hypothetical protein